MGIDILKLHGSNLLPTLGKGDWVLALPNDYPDAVIPAAWRKALHHDAARHFVRWVLNGISVQIRHDLDPSWDCSGDAFRYQTDSLLLLTRYETLQAWFDGEYTGNSTASFVSGIGLFWDTYGDDVESDIDDALYKHLKAHLQSVLSLGEDDDLLMELYDQVSWVQSAATDAIMLEIGLMPTRDAWQDFEADVRMQLAEEQRQAEERAVRYRVMRSIVLEFWRQHFPDAQDQRIEKPQFIALDMANRLRNVLADTDPTVVEAIVEVGLPGQFSNSVEMEIQYIARQALQ